MNRDILKRIIALLLVLLLSTFLLSGCTSGSRGDGKCAYCGGAGYIRNGARNATEYAFMKKVCPRCGGTGRSK